MLLTAIYSPEFQVRPWVNQNEHLGKLNYRFYNDHRSNFLRFQRTRAVSNKYTTDGSEEAWVLLQNYNRQRTLRLLPPEIAKVSPLVNASIRLVCWCRYPFRLASKRQRKLNPTPSWPMQPSPYARPHISDPSPTCGQDHHWDGWFTCIANDWIQRGREHRTNGRSTIINEERCTYHQNRVQRGSSE